MGSFNIWNEDTYMAHKGAVNILYDHCRSRCFELDRIDSQSFSCYGTNYDPTDQIGSGIRRFKEATARLNALQEAMNSYWQEYNGMLESSQGTMDQVDVSNQMYGSFEGVLAGGAAAAAAAYAGSHAYQFHQAGFNFSEHFSDAETYMSEDYFQHFEVLEGLSNIGKWETLTLDLLFHGGGSSPTDYSQGLMENALLSSLAMVPAYDITIADGDISAYLAELTGKPDLEKEIRKIISWINKNAANGNTDEFVDQLCAKLSELLYSLGMGDKVSGLIESLSSKAFLLEFFGKMAEIGVNAVDIAETYLDITLNAAINHMQQVSYLDSVQEALSMCGYEGGGLDNMLGEIRSKLSSKENYIWQSIRDELDSMMDSQLGDLTTEITGRLITNVCKKLPNLAGIAEGFNPIGSANVFWSGVSVGVNALAGDQIQAVETLRGLQMYTQPLITSYERYMSLMDAGIASAEDVKQAENLFELIRASKMKEYECIQTIDMYGYWHDLAKEKYEELESWGPAVWEQIGLSENPVLAGRRDA